MLPLLAAIRFLPALRLMIFTANFGQVYRWFGQLHVHLFHLLDDDLRNCQIAKPLMIRWNDKPGSMFGARFVKYILERLDVITPIFAFFVIRVADLPLAIRVIQSLLEPGKLFLFRNVQEKFENRRVVLRRDQPFKIVYLIVSFRPDLLRRQIVNSYYQHVFIVGTIENSD